jgi:hypothetical protein
LDFLQKLTTKHQNKNLIWKFFENNKEKKINNFFLNAANIKNLSTTIFLIKIKNKKESNDKHQFFLFIYLIYLTKALLI